MKAIDIFTQENSFVTLPFVPTYGFVIFPRMNVIFDVDTKAGVAAVERAFYGDRRIVVGLRMKGDPENYKPEDVSTFGVMCEITHYTERRQDSVRISVTGLERAVILSFDEDNGVKTAEVCLEPDEKPRASKKLKALHAQAMEAYDDYCRAFGGKGIPNIFRLNNDADPVFTADFISQNLNVNAETKQDLLETLDVKDRLASVTRIIYAELESIEVEREIEEKLHERFGEVQRENYLRERIRVMQEELGESDYIESDEYRGKILAAKLPKAVEEKLLKENDRLMKQAYGSSESALLRSYIETVLELPWNSSTKERLDIDAASKILQKEHYGLDKVKERIIEYLAVRKLSPDVKGGILCLVGPPGVGKTSIAISIAHATNRKLARMSLGGVHDEAEIRGHRKTYVGAMPGRIMNAISQCGSNNPLLLLDEIDKLGSDYRGDPSSALLEALDPEQNTTFRDHYLEVPFDLSGVFFITTANTLDTIPRPLLDRMEVIEIGSYTDEEKLAIAKQYLLPKERKKHGLDGRRLKVSDDAIRGIISGYTRESGVRQLERELAAICRKTAAGIATGEALSVNVKPELLEELLGPKRFKPEVLTGKDAVGVVNGLAWTQVGGELLEVEAAVLDGTGKLELTGNLGDVMKESARAAITCIRGRAARLGISPDFYREKDIHLHFPEGATPKDGPSAGITIATAVISALTGIPVRRDMAMTGEITITGRVLPIGGLKEKTMAAYRNGVKTVLIPRDNESDLEEIDKTVRRELTFIPVADIDDVIRATVEFPKREEKPARRRKKEDASRAAIS